MKIKCLFKAGKDFVETELHNTEIEKIIKNGKKVKSNKKEYPICIDGTWYFKSEGK